jgi:hypothetical protein
MTTQQPDIASCREQLIAIQSPASPITIRLIPLGWALSLGHAAWNEGTLGLDVDVDGPV